MAASTPSGSIGLAGSVFIPALDPGLVPTDVVDSEGTAMVKSMKIKGFTIDSGVVNFVGNRVK
jgi:hypothetical protein